MTPMMSEDFVREWFSDLVEAQSSLRTLTAICGEQQVARLEDAADRLPAAFGIVRPLRAPVLLALDGEPQFALHADPVPPGRHPDRERRLVRSGGNGERGDRGEGPAGTSSGQPHVSVTSVHAPLAFMVSDTKGRGQQRCGEPEDRKSRPRHQFPGIPPGLFTQPPGEFRVLVVRNHSHKASTAAGSPRGNQRSAAGIRARVISSRSRTRRSHSRCGPVAVPVGTLMRTGLQVRG